MILFKKINLAFQLIKFLTQYPQTLLVGGPNFLSFLGCKRISTPYGFYSQCGQDALILNQLYKLIIKPDFPKIFIDVGCNHPLNHNNSYFFERHLNFRVIGIDALNTHKTQWAELRPKSELIISAVGNHDGVVEFEEVVDIDSGGDMFSSVSGSSKKVPNFDRQIRSVPLTTLGKIFREKNLKSIGIMSLDIEGYELEALKGINWGSINIKIIVLENNSISTLGDDSIRKYLISKGYIYFARIWGMDDIFVEKE